MNPIVWPNPQRQQHFQDWLQPLVQPFNLRVDTLCEAVADASTRRYLRIMNGSGGSYIVMDAPPESNHVPSFLQVAEHMRGCGLHIPSIFAADEHQGFLLLSDLGTQPYLQALQDAQARGDTAQLNRLMHDATQALLKWQTQGDAERLPLFDEAFVLRELNIFKEWCVEREYGQQWSELQLKWWAQGCKVLAANIALQPFVPMHRDFMPRNLMVCPAADGNPGVLDFQDAVKGPISYDFASLLRDTFVSWDEAQELDWAIRYWEQARKLGLPINADFGSFWQQLEWTGLQRHLKILGIFCRLKHRDNKPLYAQDLPRFFAYAIKVTTRYVQLSPLTRLLQELQGSMVETSFTLR